MSFIFSSGQDGGDASGLYNLRRSVDNDTGKRINASTAYYKPVSKHQNLKVLLGAQTSLSHLGLRCFISLVSHLIPTGEKVIVRF